MDALEARVAALERALGSAGGAGYPDAGLLPTRKAMQDFEAQIAAQLSKMQSDFDKKLSQMKGGASSTKPLDVAEASAGLNNMAEDLDQLKCDVGELKDSLSDNKGEVNHIRRIVLACEREMEEILRRSASPTSARDLEGTPKAKSDNGLENTKKHMNTAQFKREVQDTILEYFNSGDKAEVGRCVRDLSPLTPSRSAEVIRKIMVLAMERSGVECEQAFKLIVFLWRKEDVDDRAVEGGFEEMYQRMNDILLDIPDARDMAWSFVVEAKKEGMLSADWSPPEPQAS